MSELAVMFCGKDQLCRTVAIQGCMEDAGAVEMRNSVQGTLTGGCGALVSSAENFNLSTLESKHRIHSSDVEGDMLSCLSFL